MAKNPPSSEQQPAASAPRPLATREGLRKFTGDVVGFRDLEKQGPIYGIPRGAKANDSKLEPKKSSVFVIFELLEDTEVTEGGDEDGKIITAKKGDMVGVWMKGGMRPIRNLCGVSVLMQHTGEKRLKDRPKAQSPMKTYQFDIGKEKGGLIPIIEDNRRESRDNTLFLDPKPVLGESQKRERQPGEDEEDINF